MSQEVRAAWLATNWNLDWPQSNLSPEAQKKQLDKILDQLQEANFNTVLFQVRVRGDVFYQSNIEPWSPFLEKGERRYDPLKYAIEACHKRGLECHAWFVTYPVGTDKHIRRFGSKSIVKRHPEICKRYQGEWYLDPGHPQTKSYILSLVDELINTYDIDGIHFDYIRYPENALKFPDSDTYKKYGYGKTHKQWRLDNITELVNSIYNRVKSRKPWVQVSCSPLGRYRNLDPMRGTWTAYESVYQDAGLWLRKGIMDAVYPMLYYKGDEFGNYLSDWLKTNNGRFVVPGLGVYRMLRNEGNWSLTDITQQMDVTQRSNAAGLGFFRVGNLLDNTKALYQTIKKRYYRYPAKLPPMTWLKNTTPEPPQNVRVYREKNGLVAIEWDSSNPMERQTYTVYESSENIVNRDNPQAIVMTRIHGRKLYINTEDAERGVYFSVTASDRFHNESKPSVSVYFILSSRLQK